MNCTHTSEHIRNTPARSTKTTTIGLGPGFLHTKQKEWLFDVHGI
jgi:hypothetical protein